MIAVFIFRQSQVVGIQDTRVSTARLTVMTLNKI